jgi:hypothetical protein
MKKLVITSIGVTSFANFLGLLGAVTGAIKAIVLPVLALIGAGSLGDVDSAIKGVSAAVTSDISSIVTFGVGGWVGGAVYAWIANFVLGWTKGVTVGAK